jgi:hypothetical protein
MENKKISDLLLLIEKGPHMFYEHISVEGLESKIELQWINNIWQYRKIPYKGEWVRIGRPNNILGLDLTELHSKMIMFLLSEHYCYHEKLLENDFRKKQIERVVGKQVCIQSIAQFEQFKIALKSAICEIIQKEKKIVPIKKQL